MVEAANRALGPLIRSAELCGYTGGLPPSIERVFDPRSVGWVAALEPSVPEIWHVWVRGHGEHSPTQPGLVLQWQYTPIRNATAAAWSALVLVAPFPYAVVVRWVSADQLVPIADPAPRP